MRLSQGGNTLLFTRSQCSGEVEAEGNEVSFFMRPTPALDLIAESVGAAMPKGVGRAFLSTLALDSLKIAMASEERRRTDAGEAFGDDAKVEVAELFARHSPSGFFLSLPEIIGTNAMRFDDEEILESCIIGCLDSIFSKGTSPPD